MTGCGIIVTFNKNHIGLGKIVMKMLLADECLPFRERVRNKQIAGLEYVTLHFAGQSFLMGAYHG